MSYLLLVVTVVVGAFWLDNELDDQKSDQCVLLQVQLQLLTAELDLFVDIDPTLAERDTWVDVQAAITSAQNSIDAECAEGVGF